MQEDVTPLDDWKLIGAPDLAAADSDPSARRAQNFGRTRRGLDLLKLARRNEAHVLRPYEANDPAEFVDTLGARAHDGSILRGGIVQHNSEIEIALTGRESGGRRMSMRGVYRRDSGQVCEPAADFPRRELASLSIRGAKQPNSRAADDSRANSAPPFFHG